jgi:hypothetical protein
MESLPEMPDLASTSPYIRAAKKHPKVKQQAAERMGKRPGKPEPPKGKLKP